MMAAVTTTAPDALRVDAVFYRTDDLAGLIWEAADTIDPPLLRYETVRDFRGCTLAFHWRASGLMPLDAGHMDLVALAYGPLVLFAIQPAPAKFSANELLLYEALGLCGEGEAHDLIDRGDTTYGGRWVVNPSGGLISKGHPLGATGLAQCAELTWQLRGTAEARMQDQ